MDQIKRDLLAIFPVVIIIVSANTIRVCIHIRITINTDAVNAHITIHIIYIIIINADITDVVGVFVVVVVVVVVVAVDEGIDGICATAGDV